MYPYVKVGGTFASSTQINAVIYGAGIRSDYRFEAFGSAGCAGRSRARRRALPRRSAE